MALEHPCIQIIGAIVLVFVASCLAEGNNSTLQNRQIYHRIRCSEATVKFQDPADCSRYYQCNNWQALRTTCPTGLLFDPSKRECDHISDPGNCQMPDSWLHPGSGRVGDHPTITSFMCHQATGKFQDRADCSRYYECTNWQAQRKTCRSGQFFNPSRRECGNINNPGGCQIPAGWRPSDGDVWGGQSSGTTYPSIRCTGQYNRLFQDPNDCSSYLVCNNNQVTRRSCQAGEVYNPMYHHCGDYPTPSGCQSLGMSQRGPQVQTGRPRTYRCPQSHGKFQDTEDCSSYYVCPKIKKAYLLQLKIQCTQASGSVQDPTDCSRYYECINWRAERRTCARGLLYDPSWGTCRSITNPSGCQKPAGWRPSGGGTWGGQPTGSTFQCQQARGKFQDRADCSRYYECTNWQAQRKTCRSGQLFNPSRRECGNINNPGGCQIPAGWRPSDGDVWDRQSSGTTFRCQQARGKFQDRADCSRYYECTNWQAQRKTCRSGQLFNPSRRECGNINNPGGCQIPAGWRPSDGDVWGGQSSGTTFRCQQARGKFQDRADCSRYYECTNWQAQRKTCRSGQLFNPSRRECGNINNPFGCQIPAGWRPSDGDVWGGQSSGTTFRCQQARGKFQDRADCSRYYECTNWQAQRKTCRSGQLFNPSRRECGNINNPGGCQIPAGWRPSGSGVTGIGTRPSTSYPCPEAKGEFTYEPDCSKFVRCDHSYGTVMDCPGQLLFNSLRGYCDWPHYRSQIYNDCRMPSDRGLLGNHY